jgi:hypothetical protein
VNSLATAKQQSLAPKRRGVRWGVPCLIGFVLVAGIVYWWRNGGRAQLLLALQPDFMVTQIDRQDRTMTLARTNEAYVVSCGNTCDLFMVGKGYSMLDRGDALEWRRKRQKIELPILQEHVDFEIPPGGHG